MPYTGAKAIFWQKVILIHKVSGDLAVAELKVWRMPRSERYPEGVKYSMFLVCRETGRVLVGFDNHSPKGHHLHEHGVESSYSFRGVKRLVKDFWDRAKRRGFEP